MLGDKSFKISPMGKGWNTRNKCFCKANIGTKFTGFQLKFYHIYSCFSVRFFNHCIKEKNHEFQNQVYFKLFTHTHNKVHGCLHLDSLSKQGLENCSKSLDLNTKVCTIKCLSYRNELAAPEHIFATWNVLLGDDIFFWNIYLKNIMSSPNKTFQVANIW